MEEYRGETDLVRVALTADSPATGNQQRQRPATGVPCPGTYVWSIIVSLRSKGVQYAII